MDLSKYRLTSDSQIQPFIKKIGWKNFKQFMERTYDGLTKVEKYDVLQVKEEHRDMFIKTVCYLIFHFGLKASFNETFTELRIWK